MSYALMMMQNVGWEQLSDDVKHTLLFYVAIPAISGCVMAFIALLRGFLNRIVEKGEVKALDEKVTKLTERMARLEGSSEKKS